MSNEFVNVGFDNMVNIDKITLITTTNNNPARKLIQKHKDAGTFYDATLHRTGKSIIVTDIGIILSALSPSTITNRIYEAIR